jgi:putative FmdB family regulatory protein
MPNYKIYDFECSKCKKVFEYMSEDGEKVKCPECGAKAKKVVLGGPKSRHISWSQWRVPG